MILNILIGGFNVGSGLDGRPSDEEELDAAGSNPGKSRARCCCCTCCKCNCLLCPFAFYSAFAILSFASIALGLAAYTYSLCYVKNAYLIYDYEFVPEHITRAYQHNPWLFDIQRLGASFYTALAAFIFYALALVNATCVTCRIEMSPAWRRSRSQCYEVLQMNEYVLDSGNHLKNHKLKSGEAAEKSREKKSKKRSKKNKDKGKSKGDELDDNATAPDAGDTALDLNTEDSCESQALTAPKTRINAIDNSFE